MYYTRVTFSQFQIAAFTLFLHLQRKFFTAWAHFHKPFETNILRPTHAYREEQEHISMNVSQSIQYFIYMCIGLLLPHYQFPVAVFFIAFDAAIQIKVPTFIIWLNSSNILPHSWFCFTAASCSCHGSHLRMLTSTGKAFTHRIKADHLRDVFPCCAKPIYQVLIALPFFSMVNPIKHKSTKIFPNVCHTSAKRYFNMKLRC